jgi:putative colanic acid biosynthesis acetyltransferase WcaF
MQTTRLDQFQNNWYRPGSAWKRGLWHYVSLLVFESGLFPIYKLKVFLLRVFGAKLGVGVCIKPNVHIKFPWKLTVGNHVWIGEQVWIDNLAEVSIGNHVCISQGAYLLTGNHDFKKASFDLLIGSIVLEDGVWIGAKTVVCPGVTAGSHSILTVGSVANRSLEPFGIYRGNPAEKIRDRMIEG